MTLAEALSILHIDQGDNDDLVRALIAAIPPYIETCTGLKEEYQDSEQLVKTVSGLLLTQWYYQDHCDVQNLSRTIDALLKAISARARAYA